MPRRLILYVLGSGLKTWSVLLCIDSMLDKHATTLIVFYGLSDSFFFEPMSTGPRIMVKTGKIPFLCPQMMYFYVIFALNPIMAKCEKKVLFFSSRG